MLRLPDPSPAGERMAAKLVRDQIRQRHHPERGDIPHYLIDPLREVPARALRVRLAPMAMACRVTIATRVTIGSRPRRLDITIDIHGSQTAPCWMAPKILRMRAVSAASVQRAFSPRFAAPGGWSRPSRSACTGLTRVVFRRSRYSQLLHE